MMSSACQNGDYNIYQYLSFDDTGLRKYNKKLECLYCKDVPEKNLEGGGSRRNTKVPDNYCKNFLN